jgi:rhodanese-related sulfurtransferase
MISPVNKRQSPNIVPWIVAGIILAGGAIPLAFYALFFGSVATLTPQEAKELLRQGPADAVLIDVRRADEFAAGHIDGALNWPLDSVLNTDALDNIPPAYRGSKILFICNVGVHSCLAARHVAALGKQGVFNVRGGIQEWIRSLAVEQSASVPANQATLQDLIANVTAPQGGLFDRWRMAPDKVVDLPFRQSPPAEQAAAVLSFFMVKPIYEILSLALIIVLWKSRSPDLVALRWAMIFFFLGENACALNYFLFKETSYMSEYLHSYGMLVCFSFAAYALLEGVDRRILRLSDPDQRCAAIGLCGSCVKYAEVPCGLKLVFYLLIPALIALAFMLPAADWQDNAYNTAIFGRYYNYAHLRIYQFYENWFCAAAAILMLGIALLILCVKRENPIGWAKIAFAAGIGPLGFGMLRMILGAAYDQNRVWYLFWEESTELLFIASICFILWFFRKGLFAARS